MKKGNENKIMGMTEVLQKICDDIDADMSVGEMLMQSVIVVGGGPTSQIYDMQGNHLDYIDIDDFPYQIASNIVVRNNFFGEETHYERTKFGTIRVLK